MEKNATLTEIKKEYNKRLTSQEIKEIYMLPKSNLKGSW